MCAHTFRVPRAVLLVLAACGSATPPPKTPEEPTLVKTSLVANATHVPAGGEVELGVRFEMAPGWHIYWVNPGESGLATEVEVQAPAGFEVGEARFPGPRSFPDETGVTYGWEGETVAFVKVRAPATAAGTASFTAKASFLACREACVKGEGTATLELPVGAAQPANAKILLRHFKSLPRPAREDVQTRWIEEDDTRLLVVWVQGATIVELFPFADQPALVRDQQLGVGVTRVRFQKVDPPAVPTVRGVLRVDDAYHSFERSWQP